MVLVRAVAEVQAEHVRPGLEQAADDLRAGARRAEGGDDLGVAVTAHVYVAACTAALSWRSEDEDGAEVVDVGQGRAGDDLVAQRLEEAVAVVVGQARLGVDPARGGAGQGVGRDDGAGDLLGPVHAVGVAGQREHARQAVQLDGEREQELDIAPAASAAPSP